MAGKVEGKVVSIDGKTIRCASKMSDDTLPIHILSAWADENRMVIAQLKLELIRCVFFCEKRASDAAKRQKNS